MTIIILVESPGGHSLRLVSQSEVFRTEEVLASLQGILMSYYWKRPTGVAPPRKKWCPSPWKDTRWKATGPISSVHLP